VAKPMLAGLDRIAWSEQWVYACYPNSSHDGGVVPRLLRTLGRLRGGERRRRVALDELECRLEHQGGLADATEHAIPFLYELLRERPGRAWQRRELVKLLELFAVPQPGNLFPEVVDPERDYAAFDPRCFHACAEPALAHRCFVAVEAGVETILPFVRDPSVRVACQAIGLCALFRRRADVTLPVLRAPHVAEPCAAVALIADAMLAGGERRGQLLAALEASSPMIRAAAACAVAIALPEELPAATIPAMLAAPATPVPFAFGGADFADVACACMMRLPARHDGAVIEALIDELTTHGDVYGNVLWLLLSRAFPDDAPNTRSRPAVGRAPDKLSPLQRSTLEAVRDHADLDDHAAAGTVSQLGVPTTREGLAAWLAIR